MNFQNHNLPSPKACTRSFIQAVPAPVFAVWACIIAIAAIGLVASIAEAKPVMHKCFSTKVWGGGDVPDSKRPCVALVANRPEPGTIAFIVSDADGVVRYSGYVDTPFNHVYRVHIVGIGEDGSFCWLAINRTGSPDRGCIGNLDD